MKARVHSSHAALSVPEWLAILATLLILSALFFPGYHHEGVEKGRSQASTDTQSIVVAVKSYVTEYGGFPGETDPTTPAKDDIAVGDPAAGLTGVSNAALFDILRALPSPTNPDNVYNEKKIVFIESKSVSDPRHPRSGFVDAPNAPPALKGCFFDNWGHQYCVVMDNNRDGQLDLSRFYQDFSGSAAPRVKVGAFSLGKDGKLGRGGNRLYRDGNDKSDDIVSWSF